MIARGTGGFVNIGYEWKLAGGRGSQLGGGVQYRQEVSATDGLTTVEIGDMAGFSALKQVSSGADVSRLLLVASLGGVEEAHFIRSSVLHGGLRSPHRVLNEFRLVTDWTGGLEIVKRGVWRQLPE